MKCPKCSNEYMDYRAYRKINTGEIINPHWFCTKCGNVIAIKDEVKTP
jgi:ribosomal protein S27AE